MVADVDPSVHPQRLGLQSSSAFVGGTELDGLLPPRAEMVDHADCATGLQKASAGGVVGEGQGGLGRVAMAYTSC